jgi:hypothetical protein
MTLNKTALSILITITYLTSITPACSCPDYLNVSYKDEFSDNVLTTGREVDFGIEKSIIPRLIGDGNRVINSTFQLISTTTHQPITNQAIVVSYTDFVYCKKAPCPQPVNEWTGRTNSEGVLSIPSQTMKYDTKIAVAGFQQKILQKDLHDRVGITKIELSIINP